MWVSPDAKRAIERISAHTGIPEIQLCSRMFRWFGTQDDVTQAAILGLLPPSIAPDVAKLVLERMSKKKP